MSGQISPFASALLGVATLGVFVLVFGGVAQIRRGDRQKGLLMIAAAIVLVANVLIWTI